METTLALGGVLTSVGAALRGRPCFKFKGAHGGTPLHLSLNWDTSLALTKLYDESFCCIHYISIYGRPLGSVVEHSLHTRGVSSSNLLAGTTF